METAILGIDGNGNGEATRNPEMSIFPYNLVKSLLDEKQMFYMQNMVENIGVQEKKICRLGKKNMTIIL